MNGLNDSLSDLFANAGTPAQVAEARPLSPKVEEHAEAVAAGFFDTCRKCNGSGLYRGRSSYGSRCFACQGKGGRTYKTSPEARKANREKANARKVAKAEELAAVAKKAADDWRAAHPEIASWLASNGSDFARSLSASLDKFGSLTDGQANAVLNSIARDKARAEEQAQRVASAPVAQIEKLRAAFDSALANKLRFPKVRIEGFEFTLAGASSKWFGSIYAKLDGEYIGRVTDGRFVSTRACSESVSARVLEIMADPAKAAKTHGLKTGTCSCCGRELTNQQSVELGIGPICAGKFGW